MQFYSLEGVYLDNKSSKRCQIKIKRPCYTALYFQNHHNVYDDVTGFEISGFTKNKKQK